MNYKEVKKLSSAEFKRFCGVHPETFEQMVKVVAAEKILQKKPGRPSKLSIEDQILMTLAYWREYRTYFHLATTWGLDEANAYRNIKKVENILIKSGLFNLPGKKVPISGDCDIEIVVIDVAEQEIERPKKNRSHTIAANKNAIH
jgi:hypothetical protein